MGGDGLDGEGGAGEELSDGTEAVLAEEVLVAHAGEHVNGSAEFACIDSQASCYFARGLELMMSHVDGQDGVEDAVVDFWHGERLYGNRCEEVFLLVDENVILDGDVALVEGVGLEGFHLIIKRFCAIPVCG